MPKKTSVIGAGSWGTALAIHAANCGHKVELWVHSEDTLKVLTEKRVNEIYLPGFPLPESVTPTSNIETVAKADYIIFAIPSIHFRQTFLKTLPFLREGAILISAIKGMEPDSSKRISEIVKELSNDRFVYSVLSGPSFAKEVAQQNPTAVVIGSENKNVGKEIQKDFSSSYFRLYYNSDVLGIEIGGCVKNIIAIAAGVVSGLGYGYNTLAGLITRGLAEVNRLSVNLGANPSTLMGLAGLGDLVLTCTGHLSRNRQVGVELGKGKKIDEITRSMRMVAEGVRTTQGIYALAKKRNVSMPITEQVYKVLYEDHDLRSTILELMSRELKEE
ncbi:MAG TPA: NAD(P)H-dependent glycerol-3-phosphate dehydrogenase [Acidobacteriota bacterium]|nr:NAD(P)H-dependent glycerol-3-phosphate dehydrogenase [Acidobacteriota bacterium]